MSLGTSWVYLRSGPDAIQVTESGRRTAWVTLTLRALFSLVAVIRL